MSTKLKLGVEADVNVSELLPDPNQPRKTFSSLSLKELGESMKVRQEHAIVVQLVKGKLFIFDGERRWRAAKLVKLKTLRCILRPPESAVDTAAAQVATSYHREGLSPIELADWLVDQQKRQHLSTNELLAALAKRGISDIDTLRLDKLMKLAELPAWSKKMVEEGDLRVPAAVELVPALKDPEVLAEIKEDIEEARQWNGVATIAEVKEFVSARMYDAGVDLNAGTQGNRNAKPEDIRQFPITVCKGCEHYRKLGKTELCMNRAEFDRKNKEALKLTGGEGKKKDGKEAKLSAAEKRREAKAKNERAAARQLGRKASMRLHLERYLRSSVQTIIRKHLTSTNSIYSSAAHAVCAKELLTWLALQAPNEKEHWGGGPRQRHEEAAKTTRGLTVSWKINTLADVVKRHSNEEYHPNQDVAELACAAVRVMTQTELRYFARDVLRLKLETMDFPAPPFRISADYLRIKSKDELIAIGTAVELDPKVMGTGKAIKAALLEPAIIDRIGVPADIVALYAEALSEYPDEEEDEALDDDEPQLADAVCIECGCSHLDPCEGGCAWIAVEGMVDIGNGVRMQAERAAGICTACPTDRWDAGERTLSEAARAHLDMVAEMTRGEQTESAAEIDQAIASQLKTEKSAAKRSRKRDRRPGAA